MDTEKVRIREMSLAKLQALNESIYSTQNKRNYDASRMVSRIHRYVTQVLKGVRREKTQYIPYYLSMGFSWSLALANRFEIQLDNEMWERFPGYCPYCRSIPCSCTERPENRSEGAPVGDRPKTLREYQEMFREIYPHNTTKDSAIHLAEEIGEVDEAVEFYMGTHQPELFEDIVVELVDTITNMCAVASCLQIDLALEMENQFSQGCPKCHGLPCFCGFTTAKSVSIQ